MKKREDIPKEGQFIAMWEYDNKIWAMSYRWNNGILQWYDLLNGWKSYDYCLPENIKVKFIEKI